MSRRLTEYLAAMEDRFQVSVLTLKTPDHTHIEKYRGHRLMRVPVGEKDLASRIQAFDRAVRRQLESEEYAVVHFTDPFGGYALCEARSTYGYKLVYEAQSFPSQELKHTTPAVALDRRFLNRIRRQELYCLMNADAVITGSNVTKSFIHSLGVPEESVRVLRQPVDLNPYKADVIGQPDGERMRALYLGSAWAWQGVLTLIDAARWAADEADLSIAIVGGFTPEITAELEERIANLKLKDVVQLQPPVPHDDLFKVVAASDLGVAPLDPVDRNSHQGGALSKVAEYFAGGRPVLAGNVPLAHEVVSDEAGIFFEAGDPRSLASELVKLANDKETRKRLGKRARVLAEQRHDSKRIQKQLLDVYSLLLGSKMMPAEGAMKKSDSGSSPGTPTSKAQSGRRKRGEKTDPAIRTKKGDEPSTDPAKSALGEAPVLMGVPVRAQEPPPSEEVRTDRAEPQLAKPPPTVVPDSFVGVSPAGALLTGSGKPPLPEPPAELAAKVPAAPEQPAPPPMSPSKAPPPPAPPPLPSKADEPAEVSPDEVMEADGADADDAEPISDEEVHAEGGDDEAEPISDEEVQAHGGDDEPEPISDEEVMEADEGGEQAGPSEDAHVLTKLNPWYAQLVHGHCPPEGTKFVRPTPPTNFPGREAAPPTSAAPVETLRPKAEK